MRNKLFSSPLILTISYAVNTTTLMVPCLSISRCGWAHLKLLSGTLVYEKHVILTAVPITMTKLHWLSVMKFLCFSAIALCRTIWVAMKSVTVLGSDENCTDQAIAQSDGCTPHKGFH